MRHADCFILVLVAYGTPLKLSQISADKSYDTRAYAVLKVHESTKVSPTPECLQLQTYSREKDVESRPSGHIVRGAPASFFYTVAYLALYSLDRK